VNESVPPAVIAPVGTYALFHAEPFQVADWMYGALSAAPLPLIVRVLPLGSVMTSWVNIGEPSARSEVPGVSGYMPSADQTYHELISPRSSLPARPPGASVQIWSWICRMVSWVWYGSPV
jgi:hypothetical protein